MKITDRYLQSLKSTGKQYQVREENSGGFVVSVSKTGVKTFYSLWMDRGKNCRLNLGNYPTTTLADARAKHRAVLDDRHHGIDPRGEKVVGPKIVTVADICAAHVEWAKLFKRRWEDDERYLTVEVVNKIGELPADQLTRRMVVDLLDAIVKRGAPVSANNLLKTWRRAWNVAIEKGLIETSPFTMVKNPAPSVSKSRALSEEEIKVFWQVISTAGRVSEDVRAVLKLILVTAQRPSECLGINAGEISGEWWTIPAERHKQHKAHSVYLSPLAVSLIAPYSVQIRSVSHAIKRLIHSGTLPLAPFTPHDLRRTAATGMARIGIAHETIERVLGHSIAGVGAIYNRHDYREEIRVALTTWGEYLQGITATVSTRR